MSNEREPLSEAHVLPSRLPPPTGSLIQDSLQSARHIGDIPCARNAFLTGIVGGAGMGIIRGLSTSLMGAGHWAMGTCILLSVASWNICQYRFQQERTQLTQMMESMRKRPVRDNSEKPRDPSATAAS
ncbi:hypothetical protein HYPSUDRAFT_39153 [Hypholoma sublateritium FD-334 SS-4]|uniref:Cytochrome c oxidase assembly protein COX20, mitochondrial n=1 Tax=Hypholoma sublateritium (strain FD-334 SS-4) TaxID=945553 RepID=A0A0D2PX48_HYPSF|nr:hypothetical protein HYPSUDRAFT_39153 [Hypholoma sublateritium FD-334 SS-4]